MKVQLKPDSECLRLCVIGLTLTLRELDERSYEQRKKTMTGAQILWDCLVREGRQRRVRLSGRRDSARLRRDARLPDPPRARAARAGRDAHGRRLRARDRQGRRRHRHLGSGRHQHGDRHRHRDDGLVADRLHHRPGGQPADRIGRVSGNRHHRHHAADHEAQLPGHARERRGAGDPRGVRRRRQRTARAGARRHHEGRAARQLRVRLGSGGAGYGHRWPGRAIRAASIRSN